MAIFHCATNVISRSKGRSSVAAAAYRSGEKLQDERQGLTFDYSAKNGVVHSEIMYPEHAPDWVKDREQLWNAVEQIEKRKDAQLAREITLALPVELKQDEWIELIREYCQINYIDKGMIADWSIHADNPNNPHAHIMLTLREINSDGFGAKVRAWNNPELIINQRKSLEELINLALYKAGFDKQVSCLSLAEKGSLLTPNLHLGPSAHHALERGETLNRTQEFLETLRVNGDKLIQNPGLALIELTEKTSTFSERDIYRFVNSNTADKEQFDSLVEAVKGSPQLVTLGQDDNRKTVYTSREMIKLEHSMLNQVYELEAKEGHAVSPVLVKTLTQDKNLSPGQLKALEHVVSSGDFKAVIGFAGTGKSYLMGCAKEVWEASGFRVRGMALSGIAAEGLEQGSHIPSRTLDSHLHQWGQGKDPLTANDILVIDEAGMLGTQKMEQLVGFANSAHAKVVVLGDDEQLPAINAGAPFRVCVERVGAASLAEIIRQYDPSDAQKTEIMRQATKELETQKTAQALMRYALMGEVYASRDKNEAITKIINNWHQYQLEHPERSQIMMAYTRAEVKALNEAARERRIESKEIEAGQTFDVNLSREDKTITEGREFSVGDKIFFLKNENNLGVKNGHRGTIEKIEGNDFVVRLDGIDAKTVNFNLEQYNHLDYGYAGTIHKNQGGTVDKSYLLTSPFFDRYLSCVGLTRHRLEVEIHYTEDNFKSFDQMTKSLSRENVKTMALDFAEARGIEPLDYSSFDPRVGEKSQREFALERIEERRLSEMHHGTQFEFLKPGQAFSGFIEKMISLNDGSQRGIIKDKDGAYKVLPESTEVKGLAGQFVNASLGDNGKLNSLTTLQIGEDSKIYSHEHIAQHSEQEFLRAEHTNHAQHEISEAYFFATPSISREIEMDFERF